MSSTRLVREIDAPRSRVYHALLDPGAVQAWMVPDGMTSQVHAFDAHEGGSFRISLTYDSPGAEGKTTAVSPGLRPTDNELGWSMSLDKLAQLVTDEG